MFTAYAAFCFSTMLKGKNKKTIQSWRDKAAANLSFFERQPFSSVSAQSIVFCTIILKMIETALSSQEERPHRQQHRRDWPEPQQPHNPQPPYKTKKMCGSRYRA